MSLMLYFNDWYDYYIKKIEKFKGRKLSKDELDIAMDRLRELAEEDAGMGNTLIDQIGFFFNPYLLWGV